MSVKNGLLTLPEDGDLLRIPGFCPDGIPAGETPCLTRTLLHEWPLSRVELAAFPELPGTPRRIVKTQLALASAEGDFYRFAGPLFREIRGDLRIPELLGRESAGDSEWLILSHEPGEKEVWSCLSPDGIRERVRRIGEVLQMPILKEAPVFTDWSAPERFAADLTEDIPALLSGGMKNPERIPDWAAGNGGICWESPCGLLHGDLKADNLLTGEGGTVLLDWQRPMRAPLPLEAELSVLLERGLPEPGSPAPADRPFAALACFSLSHWYAWAWRTCRPWPFVLGQAVKYAEAGLAMIME